MGPLLSWNQRDPARVGGRFARSGPEVDPARHLLHVPFLIAAFAASLDRRTSATSSAGTMVNSSTGVATFRIRQPRPRPQLWPGLWLLVLAATLCAGCAGLGVEVPLLSGARVAKGTAADDRLTPASPAAARLAIVSSLPTRLTALRAAFLSNDAARLARFFPQQGPVYVSVPPLQDGGFLSPGPLKAFLDRLVRERVSVGFELPASPPAPSTDRDAASAFVKVKWTHRPAASATLQVDYLHLALRYTAEDAEWQIVEIKTSIR